MNEPNGRRQQKPHWLGCRFIAALLVVSLAAGTALRVWHLGSVPPGLHPDEACEGYDAYSILQTGRDQHGHFLPLAFEAFGDYRRPLFEYSLVPLVGAFGLATKVVRLGAAAWGIVDLAALTAVAGLLLGLPGAAGAALLGALSPWHIPFCRYGMEAITGAATVNLAMAAFLVWRRNRRKRWIVLSAVFFGLSLYSYSVTEAFTPLMIGWLCVLYWPELKRVRGDALTALTVFVLIALPQLGLTLDHWSEMQARFNQLSLFNYVAACHGCTAPPPTGVALLLTQLADLGANWLGYFTPSFLFITGDRGDHWTLVHPPGFGQLLPEQAILLALSFVALLQTRRRKMALLLIGWLILSTLPAALTVPLGAVSPEPLSSLPTPVIMHHSKEMLPLSAGLLLSHPDSRHGVLAIAPYLLLSALGLVTLPELFARSQWMRAGVWGLLLCGVLFHGGRFVRNYFLEYPTIAAPYFYYGLDQAVRLVQRVGDPSSPVVFTPEISQPYILVLFFTQYPPRQFQQEPVERQNVPFPQVLKFDRFYFYSPAGLYDLFPHGTFVYTPALPATASPPVPVSVIRYPDGRIAYYVVVK